MADAPGGDGGAVDPRDPHDDDPWSSISFDEDFVKASSITEPAAAERARAASKAEAKDAARRRRRERRRRAGVFVRRYTLIWVAVAIVAVLGVMGAKGSGPLASFLHVRSGRGAEGSASSSGPTSSTSSTSTTLALFGYVGEPGECLIWDQDIGRNPRREISSVGCEEPHLFEATGHFDLADSDQYGPDGPTQEQWKVIQDENCPGYAERYLGYVVDPAGRFRASSIHPLPEAWRNGYRTVQCGIEVDRVTAPPVGMSENWTPEFVGAVRGADQTFLWGTGTCVMSAFGTALAVDCGEPHTTEVTGSTEVSGEPGAPWPGDEGVYGAAREACFALARDVYGTSLPPGVYSGSYGIAESSWNIGRRTVECLLGRSDSDQWVPVEGPLRG